MAESAGQGRFKGHFNKLNRSEAQPFESASLIKKNAKIPTPVIIITNPLQPDKNDCLSQIPFRQDEVASG